jgi:hypothetical protein
MTGFIWLSDTQRQLLRIEGVAWSAQRIPAAVNLSFQDRSRYFNFADKRRPLGRYSSLADYKPRSLVFLDTQRVTALSSSLLHTL